MLTECVVSSITGSYAKLGVFTHMSVEFPLLKGAVLLCRKCSIFMSSLCRVASIFGISLVYLFRVGWKVFLLWTQWPYRHHTFVCHSQCVANIWSLFPYHIPLSCSIITLVWRSLLCLNKGRPTWWHVIYYVNLLLNMFRMLIHPSAGACDYMVCYCVVCIVLTWGVLVLCSGIGCWWCGIRV